MAAVTTRQLLYELQQACNRSPVVSHVEERVVDADILSVRVHLTAAHTFINVFYNLTTDKVAFALVGGVSGRCRNTFHDKALKASGNKPTVEVT